MGCDFYLPSSERFLSASAKALLGVGEVDSLLGSGAKEEDVITFL